VLGSLAKIHLSLQCGSNKLHGGHRTTSSGSFPAFHRVQPNSPSVSCGCRFSLIWYRLFERRSPAPGFSRLGHRPRAPASCISARAGLLYFLFKSSEPADHGCDGKRGAGHIKPSGRLASLGGGGWPQPPCRSPSSGGPALGTNFAPKYRRIARRPRGLIHRGNGTTS
jgi:hypothetical protein